jgi:hypothetical protein
VHIELEDTWKEVVVAELKVMYMQLLEGTDDKFPVCTLLSNLRSVFCPTFAISVVTSIQNNRQSYTFIMFFVGSLAEKIF